MTISNSRKVAGALLVTSLAFASQSAHAEWIGKGKEVDYLGRELSIEPRIGLLENAHPVTHAFTGKALYFKFDLFEPAGQDIYTVKFNTDRSLTWWVTGDSEKKYTASYVVFEVAKNVYYLNWAESTAYGTPKKGVWLAAIVVDLNKMVATDTFVSPSEAPEDGGEPRYNITQLRIAFEDISKANGNERYVPASLASK